MTIEQDRLRSGGSRWRLWGPYVSDRAWGTVREDYGAAGSAWEYLSHDAARSRAYRWNEDGIAGVCDELQRLCFALVLWNGRDPILKERLFGLTGNEGNHGEDVKELYWYLDSTPTHSYMRMLYKYPQAAFPYADLVERNRRRGKTEREYELLDTGVFDERRYFDVFVEYAKADTEDLLVRITAHNRGPDAAPLHLLPTLWFRNTWSWSGRADEPRPQLRCAPTDPHTVDATHATLGHYRMTCLEGRLDGADDRPHVVPEVWFTENESNVERLFGVPNARPWVKDAFHARLVEGRLDAVNPGRAGTKATAHYMFTIPPGGSATVRVRLVKPELFTGRTPAAAVLDFDRVFDDRKADADAFFDALHDEGVDDDQRAIQRQALSGLLWSKQFFHYNVARWLDGDAGQPKPPVERLHGRNHTWRHLDAIDVLSVPDKWEYPWFAAWDLAFHCVALAIADAEFAKSQLVLMGHEWYQHPNGQTPAYEWAFGDVNPPVLAWAAWRVYQIDRKQTGRGDLEFLERVFHKMLLNFTWWVNRKDQEGNNVFEGGFLGMDNVGVFDRSAPLPTGGHLEQSDATSWMGMFCLNLLRIALELATHRRAYEDIATKFFEHFLQIAAAMSDIGGSGIALWDQQDDFFYDVLRTPDGRAEPLKVRSMVGLVPLFAVTTIEPGELEKLPEFKQRLEWFLENRPDMAGLVSRWTDPGAGERRLLAIVRGHRMKCVLQRMLDETEYLSPYGIRSLSRYHRDHPYVYAFDGARYEVAYQPAESTSGLFGGNSNWRGPIWFPVNYLLIESLQQFHWYYSDDFTVECPTGSGNQLTLAQVADEISRRLIRIFTRGADGRRPVLGDSELLQQDPHFRDLVPFYEYFHGDDGSGLGASHQTGWTALVAKLIRQQSRAAGRKPA
ncbi:MAG: glucosidase [Deltaproteobacteria bacterium]|nr:glucosidase [Deltaproteobacteria bacterium]